MNITSHDSHSLLILNLLTSPLSYCSIHIVCWLTVRDSCWILLSLGRHPALLGDQWLWLQVKWQSESSSLVRYRQILIYSFQELAPHLSVSWRFVLESIFRFQSTVYISVLLPGEEAACETHKDNVDEAPQRISLPLAEVLRRRNIPDDSWDDLVVFPRSE